ncbi:hypothetical protein RC410_004111 [Salmonella enterica]|nr:hypothetical protein [Salmonella enterica]
MTALNKQALREAAEGNVKYAQMFINPRDVLALLDDLEVAIDACNGWQGKYAEADERLRAAESGFAPLTVERLIREKEGLEKRIAELEARTITVKFEPIPMEELGNWRDGKKHPYMFGAGYNSAVVHCESVLHQACAAAGIGVKG